MPPDSPYRFPLSEHQIAWVHHVEARDYSPVPLVQSDVVCRLPLDEELLSGVVHAAVAQFDCFRTSLDLDPGREPSGLVHNCVIPGIDFHDLRTRPAEQRAGLVADRIRTAAERPFDVTRAPLGRIVVHRVDDNRFHLSIVGHPALFGRTALSAFHTEVITGYRASLGGVEHQAVEALQPEVRGAEHETNPSAREWADSFDGFSPSTPDFWISETADDGDPRQQLVQRVEIPKNLTDAVMEAAARAGVSMPDVLLAVHAKAIGVVSGRTDVVVGVEFDTQHLSGFPRFGRAEATPVRISLAAASWAGLAQRVSSSVSSARPYRDLSPLRLQRLTGLDDLFDSTFAFITNGVEADLLDAGNGTLLAGTGLCTDEAAYCGSTHVPFAGGLYAEFFQGRVLGRLALRLTAGDGLSARQLRELARLHLEILERAVRSDELHKAVPTLPESHRDLVLRRWNSEVRPYPVEWCVHELVEHQAARTPDAIAVVDSEQEFTYRELNTRANRLARYLRASGIGVADIVGVCARRDASLVVAFLGVLKSGAAYLPLDPHLPRDRAVYMLQDADTSTVLADATYADLVPDGPWNVLRVDDPDVRSTGAPDTDLGRTSTPDDLMYVIYTSGSTGMPKGVEVPHSGVVNYLGWCMEAYASKGTGGAPVFSSVAFDMVVPNLYTPLVMGQRVCMLEDSLDTAAIAQRLAALAPFGFIKLTPGQLGVLSELLDPVDARRLTAMLAVGADAFPARTLRGWRRIDDRTPILNEYGPTEASVGNSVHIVDGSEEGELLPIGRAIPNTTMYVLDSDLAPVPIGVPGELYIGGACVVRGYRNRPELTADKFIRDPFSNDPDARLYRTGDIGRWLPSGTLAFLGRVDDQVKIRGYRVEPAEVEAALVGHQDISEAVVTVVGKARETFALAGYYVGPPELAPDAVRVYLAERLPEYLVPSFLVPIHAVPLNSNGKVDRKALPEAGRGRATRDRQKAAASSDAGVRITRIWREVFGVDQMSLEDRIPDDGAFIRETQFALHASRVLGITTRDAIDAIARTRTFGELCERLAAHRLANARPDAFDVGPHAEEPTP